jgi:transposase
MKRFIEGEDRSQSTLFPERLDDYIGDDNPVKFIDAFIDQLSLLKLGFAGVEPSDTGRPAYHPSVLLKIYVYGYLNRIHSSRRLERETQRNVELMWLTGRLMPDFKTIADFRKDNGKAIKNVCRQFVMVCRQLDLFTEAIVAVDGSKFKAVNNRDKNFTPAKMERRIQQIEKNIDRYLRELDTTDHDEPSVTEAKTERLTEKIAAMTEEMERLKKYEVRMLKAPDGQLSLTDPDARSMKTRGTGVVGYNVQAVVDAKHHLIVTHEVNNVGSDRRQLSTMAKRARKAMGVQDLTVVADRGYYKGEEILACDEAGITAYVPNSRTSNNEARGLFGKRSFQYIVKDDEYRCPAGERLTRRTKTHPKGLTVYRYWSSVCGACALKSRCTTGKERRISRWEHEDVLDAMQRRLALDPDIMRLRRSTVEHPFGTLKAWMGSTHFLTMTLERVSTEMSLHVLAYNLKRVINLMGVESLIEAIRESMIYLRRKTLNRLSIGLLRHDSGRIYLTSLL